MRRVLCLTCMMVAMLALCGMARAEAVGGKFAQTEGFRHFVASQKALVEQDAALDKEIEVLKRRIEHPERGPLEDIRDRLLEFRFMVWVFSLEDETFYAIAALSVLLMPLYLFFLVRFNPMRFRLMTSGKTFGRLWRKTRQRNGLAGLALIVAVSLPGAALADTSVLQDIKMYFVGDDFEKGYVACKYDKGDIALGYAEVNGVAVIQKPAPGFDRSYDVAAHLLGLGLGVGAEDLASLFSMATTDAQRAQVFALLAKTGKDVARDGATRIIESICSQRGQDVGVSIGIFKALLSAFADSGNRLMANSLVRQFLEKSVSRVKDLAGLDSLVDLAVDNDAFEIIREATAAAMKPVPPRLPFAESVYAARIQFKLDKDLARHYFQNIRFDLAEFLKSEAVGLKLAKLMRELSGVTAFLPLYENDALYAALRRLPNEQRVALTGFFDSISPSLAAVAYNSIGMEPGDMVFANPRTLVLLARLTDTYKKESPSDFLNSLKRAIVEYNVPYSREILFEALEKVHQKPSGFVESVLTQDMNTDCRHQRNSPLIFSLIQSLTPEQFGAFETYFIKKSDLRQEILELLQSRDKDVFYRVLTTLFKESPGHIALLEFPNDIMDISAVASAFSPETQAAFSVLPAPYFVAHHALSGPTPDAALARKVLGPEFEGLFSSFLTNQKKELSEKEAVAGLILLTLAQRPGVTAFADESLVLEKMMTGYFAEAKHSELAGQVDAKKRVLEKLKALNARIEAQRTRLVATVANLAEMLCFGLAAVLFSICYGCNVIMPGRDFSLLAFFVNAMEAFGAFAMATVWLFPFGFATVLAFQLLRGLTRTDTLTRDMREGVAFLQDGPARAAWEDAGDETPPDDADADAAARPA